MEKKKLRTTLQNRALHKLFTFMATELNNAGYDMRKTLKPEVEIPWTMENVKNHLWRPIQEAYLNKESTKDLTTKELDLVYDVINRFMAGKGIHVPFPSIESLMEKLKNESKKS